MRICRVLASGSFCGIVVNGVGWLGWTLPLEPILPPMQDQSQESLLEKLEDTLKHVEVPA